MNAINPLSKKQIKSIKLLAKRSERHQLGLFVVEGLRAVRQVADNGLLEVDCLILEGGEEGTALQEQNVILAELLEKRDWKSAHAHPPVYSVPASVFRQLTDTESAQGVMAVCRMPAVAEANQLLDGSGVILATDHVQDPGNLGTMIRTSVWFGLKGVVLSPGTVDLFHPKVVRSTAGATGVLPWMESDLSGFLTVADETGWNILLLDSGPGAQSYVDYHPTGRDIIVVGNEANGLISVPNSIGSRLRIDPAAASGVESLNVSVAAAIVTAHLVTAGSS